MRIVVHDTSRGKRELDFGPGSYTIGRSTENDIVLNDNQVSRNHARIQYYPERGLFTVEDLQSSNGVFLNKRKISGSEPFEDGDLIGIGDTTLEVRGLKPGGEAVAENYGETILKKITPMILLEKVTKSYRLGKVEVQALKGLDLSVHEGEFISVCGPSGSGKSTLLNLIGCIDTPTDGKMSIQGKDVSDYNDAALSKLRNSMIGFVFQNFNLIPVLTAFENVEYPLVLLNVPKKARVEKVMTILGEVGLANFAKHKPDELSGGQRQRVAVARALVTGPKIVLADEPTANLDSKTGIEILDLMKRLNQQHATTFIFSTHDPKIERYAKKIYTMTDGVLVR